MTKKNSWIFSILLYYPKKIKDAPRHFQGKKKKLMYPTILGKLALS